MSLKLYAFTCGWFHAPIGFFIEGGEQKLVRTPIPAYFIDHPKGRAVFDTGLSYRYQKEYAEKMNINTNGLEFDESADIAAQLRAIDIDPASINWIVNSHFHTDHCGGNAFIPNATVIVQSRELTAAQVAVDSGSQIYNPLDFNLGHPIRAITGEYDLFGDGSVILFPTYGHTAGHQSVRVRLESRDVILAADCCYLKRSLDEMCISPEDVDREASLATLQRLDRFRRSGTSIFYGHDGEFWKTVPQGKVIY